MSLLFGGVILVSAQGVYGQEQPYDPNHEPATILILHSYYPTYEWSNDITAGILDVLKSSPYRDSEVYFEYMDAKRHSSPEYIASLAEVYRQKYKDPDQFDLIICSDNHAIDFLSSETGLEIFPSDIPVVFCGANDYDPTWLENRPDMTGVIESTEPDQTLNVILKAHPEAKNLLVIGDHNTHTSQIVTEQTRQAFAFYEDFLQIHYLEDMTAYEMQETVANVSEDTVIYLLLFNRDSEGNEVTMLESIGMIAASAEVPVYSSWEFYLGNGIVGGKLTNAYNEGSNAGETALKVLAGESPADIPIGDSKDHDFMFDWEQIERFSISEDDLPKGSIFINKNPSFYELYKKEILATSGLIFFLIIVVSVLLVNQEKLKATQAELLTAKGRAENADRLKSAFIANVSHELRTPLNGILGFSDMLKMPDISAEKKEQYVDIIKNSGGQLLALINDIMDISSIEAGQMTVAKQEFAVNYILFELYSVFKPQFDIKTPLVGLELETELNDVDSVICSDEQKIRQILTNLLGNAMKFTQEGSVEFGYRILDDRIMEFYVKDTGIGIPEDKFDCVFARFQQVDDSPSRRYDGTGLGMSISKGLAKILGGDIRFESEYGVGSTFYFTVPCGMDDGECSTE
ncbi:ABC transporter substrate binding protein [Methanolobus sp. ZRKC3]|uniref:sensor histidine kinase n=1 Tax=Methanolobus sp. ZRKC3 TaxID=3125786 RepID=UPI003249AAAC